MKRKKEHGKRNTHCFAQVTFDNTSQTCDIASRPSGFAELPRDSDREARGIAQFICDSASPVHDIASQSPAFAGASCHIAQLARDLARPPCRNAQLPLGFAFLVSDNATLSSVFARYLPTFAKIPFSFDLLSEDFARLSSGIASMPYSGDLNLYIVIMYGKLLAIFCSQCSPFSLS